MSRIKEKKVFVGLMVVAFCMLVSTPIVWSGPIEESNQLLEQWLKAFHEGNADALSATYARDGVYIYGQGPFRMQVEKRYELCMQVFSEPSLPDLL